LRDAILAEVEDEVKVKANYKLEVKGKRFEIIDWRLEVFDVTMARCHNVTSK